jgi:carbamoylphosphate synthase small subunit
MGLSMQQDASLILGDNTVVRGCGCGWMRDTHSHNIVVDTQQYNCERSLTTPINRESILLRTFPIVHQLDTEYIDTKFCNARGLIAGHLLNSAKSDLQTSSIDTWDSWLRSRGIPCIFNVDVGQIYRKLCDAKGKLNAKIVFDNKLKLQLARPLIGQLTNYTIGDKPTNIAIIDMGLDDTSKDILLRHATLRVFGDYDYNQVVSTSPDYILFSDGCGNPVNQKLAINLVKANLLSKRPIPMLGIGMGSAVLAIGHGLKISKLPISTIGNATVHNLADDAMHNIEVACDYVLVDKNLPQDVKVTSRLLYSNIISSVLYKKTKSVGILSSPQLLQQWLSKQLNI